MVWGRQEQCTTWRRYFRLKSSGLNAVYGDGSVRFSSFNVDAIAWMQACVIDDGVHQPLNKLLQKSVLEPKVNRCSETQ